MANSIEALAGVFLDGLRRARRDAWVANQHEAVTEFAEQPYFFQRILQTS